MIVQRFASEVIPDSKAIVRQAIDEQAEIVDQRINLLSHEVHESVKDNEIATSQLRQVILRPSTGAMLLPRTRCLRTWRS